MIVSYDDYIKNKKKKKNNINDSSFPRKSSVMSYDDYKKEYAEEIDIRMEQQRQQAIALGEAEKKKKEEKKNTWFSGGAFKDGYQFGDATKTILGTAGDLGINAVKGAAYAGENLAKLGVSGVAQVSDWIGQDDFANELRDKLAGKNEEFNQRKEKSFISSNLDKIGNKLDKYSVFGEKTDSLINSGGQLLAAIGSGPAGAFVMGGSAAGSELENAYSKGATNGEAWVSAGITAASEILFEKLSGGIKFGGSTLDDGAKKFLSDKITNKVASKISKFGLDMAGEGAEEVLTEITSNIGQKLTYEDEKTWKEMLASEEALESYVDAFIGGAVMGGTFNAGRLNN